MTIDLTPKSKLRFMNFYSIGETPSLVFCKFSSSRYSRRICLSSISRSKILKGSRPLRMTGSVAMTSSLHLSSVVAPRMCARRQKKPRRRHPRRWGMRRPLLSETNSKCKPRILKTALSRIQMRLRKIMRSKLQSLALQLWLSIRSIKTLNKRIQSSRTSK
jgi:hypothetical protein